MAQETAKQGPSRGQAAGSGGTGAQGSRRPTAAVQGVDASGNYYRVDAAERVPGPDPPSVASHTTVDSVTRRVRGANIQQMYGDEQTGDWDTSRHYYHRGFWWVFHEPGSRTVWNRGWYQLRANDYYREFPPGDGHGDRRPQLPRLHGEAQSKAKGSAGKGKQKKGGPSFGSGYTRDESWTGRQWSDWENYGKGKGKTGK